MALGKARETPQTNKRCGFQVPLVRREAGGSQIRKKKNQSLNAVAVITSLHILSDPGAFIGLDAGPPLTRNRSVVISPAVLPDSLIPRLAVHPSGALCPAHQDIGSRYVINGARHASGIDRHLGPLDKHGRNKSSNHDCQDGEREAGAHLVGEERLCQAEWDVCEQEREEFDEDRDKGRQDEEYIAFFDAGKQAVDAVGWSRKEDGPFGRLGATA